MYSIHYVHHAGIMDMCAEFACNYAMHIDQLQKKGWKQGQKLFKKESDVGMLLTGIQSTETRCM